MEKKSWNWINKIEAAVDTAMSKKLGLDFDKYGDCIHIYIGDSYDFRIEGNYLILNSPKGFLKINNFYFTEREKLKLEEILLTVKEYREAMALSELEQFINEKEDSKFTDINDLDNDE